MSTHRTGLPAHKGPRACATCAKAKARCVPGPRVDGFCERCLRLGKACPAQTPAPTRKRKDVQRPTRVAELERRIKDLAERIETRVALNPEGSAQASPGQTQLPTPGAEDDEDLLVDGASIGPFELPQDGGASALMLAPAVKAYRRLTGEAAGAALATERGAVSTQQDSARRSVEPATSTKPGQWDARWPQFQHPQTSLRPQHSKARSSASDQYASEVETTRKPVNASTSTDDVAMGQDDVQWPNPRDCDPLIDQYRTDHQSLFPFVIIPENISSVILATKKPLLWKAVILVGLQGDCERQVPLGNRLMEEIVVASFLKPSKSLEMLQALEMYIAWLHFNLTSYQLTNLLFLARSFCVSLNLHGSMESLKQEPTPQSLEQMRALTGVYYLVNMLFTTNKKPDAFANTRYIEACCNVLEQKIEYRSDALLVVLVRIQQLCQSISTTLATRGSVASPQSELPLGILFKLLRQQVTDLRASIPLEWRSSSYIVGQCYIADIILGEAALNERLCIGMAPSERLEMLWFCLKSVKAYLDDRFTAGFEGKPRYNCMSSFDVAYVMINSLKLSTLNNVPGWDAQIIRKELTPLKYMHMLVTNLKMVVKRRREGDVLGVPGRLGRAQKIEDPFKRMVDNIEGLTAAVGADMAQIGAPNASSDVNREQYAQIPARFTMLAPATESDTSTALMNEMATKVNATETPDVAMDWGLLDSIPPEALFGGQDLLLPEFDVSFWDGLEDMDVSSEGWSKENDAWAPPGLMPNLYQ